MEKQYNLPEVLASENSEAVQRSSAKLYGLPNLRELRTVREIARSL